MQAARESGIERVELEVFDFEYARHFPVQEPRFLVEEGIKRARSKLDGRYDDNLFMVLLFRLNESGCIGGSPIVALKRLTKTFERTCVLMMSNVLLSTPLIAADAPRFIEAVHRSESLHKGRVEPPATTATFEQYIKSDQEMRCPFAVCNCDGVLVGIANINAIVRGHFKTAVLVHAFAPYNGQGYMRWPSSKSCYARIFRTRFASSQLIFNRRISRSCSLIESLGSS